MVLPDLKVDVPELEPPRVLLEQLSQLSQHSTASTPSGGPGTMKALMATVTFTVIATVSWLTGTLPGVASPFTGERTQDPAPRHAPAEPSTPAVPVSDTAALVTPPSTPPGQKKPFKNKGNHTGQTKPHQNNGNHTGQSQTQSQTEGQGQGQGQGQSQANGKGK